MIHTYPLSDFVPSLTLAPLITAPACFPQIALPTSTRQAPPGCPKAAIVVHSRLGTGLGGETWGGVGPWGSSPAFPRAHGALCLPRYYRMAALVYYGFACGLTTSFMTASPSTTLQVAWARPTGAQPSWPSEPYPSWQATCCNRNITSFESNLVSNPDMDIDLDESGHTSIIEWVWQCPQGTWAGMTIQSISTGVDSLAAWSQELSERQMTTYSSCP